MSVDLPMPNHNKMTHQLWYGKPDVVTAISAVSLANKYPDWEHYLYVDASNLHKWEFIFERWDMKPNSHIILIDDMYADMNRELKSYAKDAVEKGYFSIWSDIMRVFIVLQYGGMYLDSDIIALKPMPDEWFQQTFKPATDRVMLAEEVDTIMGQQVRFDVCNAWFYAPYEGHPFMQYWMEGYLPDKSFFRGYRLGQEYKLGNHLMGTNYFQEGGSEYATFLTNTFTRMSIVLPHKHWYPIRDINILFQNGSLDEEQYAETWGFHLQNNVFSRLDLYNRLSVKWLQKNPNSLLADIMRPYEFYHKDFEVMYRDI